MCWRGKIWHIVLSLFLSLWVCAGMWNLPKEVFVYLLRGQSTSWSNHCILRSLWMKVRQCSKVIYNLPSRCSESLAATGLEGKKKYIYIYNFIKRWIRFWREVGCMCVYSTCTKKYMMMIHICSHVRVRRWVQAVKAIKILCLLCAAEVVSKKKSFLQSSVKITKKNAIYPAK